VKAAATDNMDDHALAALLAAEGSSSKGTAALLPGMTAAGSSSSSSGSSNGEWVSGACDYHPYCNVCREEQQQQQQQGCEAVPYSDSFMWRRLLWQLLGKLSPESQAFYAQYTAACPHCPDTE
jgi:hypothetical protein